ncbi:MAG: YceD family protein [Solimonas sp.]
MPIPQNVKASTAVAQGLAYRGELPLRSLERLRAELVDDSGVLQVALQAHRSHGRSLLDGTVSGELSLRCQRCDQPYAWPVQLDIGVRLVETEEEEQAVLHEADPYLVQDDSLPLREIVEDELLLALPMLPRCESCEDIVQTGAVQSQPEAKAENGDIRREPNPFAALKERLGKQQ